MNPSKFKRTDTYIHTRAVIHTQMRTLVRDIENISMSTHFHASYLLPDVEMKFCKNLRYFHTIPSIEEIELHKITEIISRINA